MVENIGGYDPEIDSNLIMQYINKDRDIVIAREYYTKLLDRDKMLSALETGGVDNWEWYGESLREYYGREDTEDFIDAEDEVD